MTIKKRLARSNIAMLVIPLLAAAVLLLLGVGAAVLLLREKCCSTQPMQLRRSPSVMAETSTPPTETVPEPGG